MKFWQFLNEIWWGLLPIGMMVAYDLGKDKGARQATKQMDQDAFLKAYREMCKARYGI